MKMTTEGEKVIGLLWDVIAAKGFERDTYFRGAGKDIGAPAKLEGTVHVNLALILKFMPNHLFGPAGQPPVPTRQDPVDDEFLFRQGPARGLGKVTFADWRLAFEPFAGLPNVARSREHAEGFTTLLQTAAPDAGQQQDLASPYASYISGALIPCDGGGAVESVKPMIEAAGRLAAEKAQAE